MFYGRNLPPLDARFKTVENKVQGCVSQVWVRAFLNADRNVQFEADSDSLLTKGLAALLVKGLSGRPAAEIARVPPDFVQMLGLQQSLTPSRNNGFLNMLRLMQKKALELDMGAGDTVGRVNEGITGVDDNDQGLIQKKAAKAIGDSVSGADSGVEHGTIKDLNFEVNGISESHSKSDGVFNFGEIESSSELDSHTSSSSSEIKLSSEAGLGSRAQKIKEILEKELCPVELELEDISHQHAGHAGVRGGVGETHFNLKIVSKEFQGKSLVKRHRIVYDLLQDELKSGLHALSIVAKTPSEVGGR